MLVLERRERREIIHAIDGQNDANIFSFIGLPWLLIMEKMGSVSGKKLHIAGIIVCGIGLFLIKG